MNQQLWFEVQAMRKAWGELNMDRFLSTHQQAKEEAMKVTAKKPCVSDDFEVVDQSTQYYIAKDACGFVVVLDKTEYEPVPDWEDVTKDCLLLGDDYGRYNLSHYGCAIPANDPQYRVTIQGNSFKVERKS